MKRCQQFSLHSVHAFVYDSTESVHVITGPQDSQEQHKSVLQGPPFRPDSFDRILLDAPCSALGQRPQLANRITANQLKSYPRLQRKLFQSVSDLKLYKHKPYEPVQSDISVGTSLTPWGRVLLEKLTVVS